MSTTNLGFVKAIHSGTTAPSNTQMIWYDTNIGVNKHKYYDTTSSSWVLLAASINSDATQVSTTGNLNWTSGEIFLATGVGTITFTDSNLVKGKTIIIDLSGFTTINFPAYWDDLLNGDSVNSYDATKTNILKVYCRENTGGSEQVYYELYVIDGDDPDPTVLVYDDTTGISTTQLNSHLKQFISAPYIYFKDKNNYWVRCLIIVTSEDPWS